MNRIEVTIDGGDIIMDGHRLDLAAAKGLRDILDGCVRRIEADAHAYSEWQRAEQRRRDMDRVKMDALAFVTVARAYNPWDLLLMRDGRVMPALEAASGRRCIAPNGDANEAHMRALASIVPDRRLWWIGQHGVRDHVDGCGCWVSDRSSKAARIMPADWRPKNPCARSLRKLAVKP